MQTKRASRSSVLANGVAARRGSAPSATTVALAAGIASLAIAFGGCGGSPPAIPPVPSSFPPDAITTVASTSGALQVALRSVPDPPVRGQNVGQLTVTDSNGQPVDGVTIEVLPWMPSHGHGTSEAVEVTDQGNGVFITNPLYLFMAGEWQIQMKFQGALDDTATAIVEIP